MPRPAPTATIQLADGTSRQITFDLAMLEQIEDSTGKSVNQILFDDLAAVIGGEPVPEGLTPEERAAVERERAAKMVRNVRASFVRSFLAAVLGLSDAAAVSEAVGLAGAMPAFTAAVAAFGEAVISFNGGEQADADGGAGGHPLAFVTSGPGHGSSSESQEPSSTG